MKTSVDYLVVGSGMTGGTIARLLRDGGREVLLLERRTEPGGNVRDFLHPSGIRVHAYGPHYFRSTSPAVWEFMNRFARFYPFAATVKIQVDGRLRDWPLQRAQLPEFAGWKTPPASRAPANFEEACLQRMPRAVYETYIAGYTRRQWGREPRGLIAALADRIRFNAPGESRLTPHHRFQGLPVRGYSDLMANLIAGIPCLLGVDYLRDPGQFRVRRGLVFTGALDEFFGFDDGRLAYRAQRRVHQFQPDCDEHQPCVQVNHGCPGSTDPVRTLEWKHLLPPARRRETPGTVITREFPFSPDDPDAFEYPVPAARHTQLYARYRDRAAAVPKLTVCGRLGDYAYLDMDRAVCRASQVARRLLQEKKTFIPGGLRPSRALATSPGGRTAGKTTALS